MGGSGKGKHVLREQTVRGHIGKSSSGEIHILVTRVIHFGLGVDISRQIRLDRLALIPWLREVKTKPSTTCVPRPLRRVELRAPYPRDPWTCGREHRGELHGVAGTIAATRRPGSHVAGGFQDGAAAQAHEANHGAHAGGIARGDGVLVVAIRVGDDVGEVGIGLGEKVGVVGDVRFIGFGGFVRGENVRNEGGRAARDVFADGESIDEADDILDVEVRFTILLGGGVLVVDAAVDEGEDGEILGREGPDFFEDGQVGVRGGLVEEAAEGDGAAGGGVRLVWTARVSNVTTLRD